MVSGKVDSTFQRISLPVNSHNMSHETVLEGLRPVRRPTSSSPKRQGVSTKTHLTDLCSINHLETNGKSRQRDPTGSLVHHSDWRELRDGWRKRNSLRDQKGPVNTLSWMRLPLLVENGSTRALLLFFCFFLSTLVVSILLLLYEVCDGSGESLVGCISMSII